MRWFRGRGTPAAVDLWDGWSLTLPTPCSTTRNDDGSWSGWDERRVVDVHIITAGATVSGRPLAAEQLLGAPAGTPVRQGRGCVWYAETFQDVADPAVTRCEGAAAAEMTLLSCSIGYRGTGGTDAGADAAWADAVWRSITHRS